VTLNTPPYNLALVPTKDEDYINPVAEFSMKKTPPNRALFPSRVLEVKEKLH